MRIFLILGFALMLASCSGLAPVSDYPGAPVNSGSNSGDGPGGGRR